MSGFAHRWFSASFMLLLMVASGQTFGQTARGCSFMYRPDDLEKCRQLADAGDIQAMLTLAEGYALGSFPHSILTIVPKDPHESIRYYTLAADLGDKTALRYLYDAYRFGFRGVPKNQARADQYLNKAAQFGSEWAILLLAQAQEKSAPKKALEAYLKLARNDNCIAQLRLAQAYDSGDLVKKNLTQSYFWLLLADVDAYNRTADVAYDVTSGISVTSYSSGQCGHAASSLRGKIKAEETLSKKLVQAAQDAATNWTKGTIEKLLPPPQITANEAGPPDTKSKIPPKVATASPVEESSPKLAGPPIASGSPTVANSPAQYPNPSSRMAVPLIQDGGIFVVPVEINGAITLEFGVDSGAADVSVPFDVFSTLRRTRTIKDSDIIGEQTYVLADGSRSRSVMFTIRSLKVGDKVVENVKGSVAPSQGTLLLGQSFLERFKSWSINNTNHELLLEPR
jgi:TPR repeat protein